MKVKEENKDKFVEAMVNFAHTVKNESVSCAKLCGAETEKEFAVVMFIGQHKSVKMSDIADNIEAPMSTLTSIVDKLVERNYVSRDHSGEDRRVINVSLTAAGKISYNKVVAKRKKIAETVLSKLNEKEQVQTFKHLNELASAILAAT